MNEEREDVGLGLVVFKPGTSTATKVRGISFFVLLSAIILAQACYWLFANQVQPIIWGMPFGMFFVVLLIIVEFLALVGLYFSENKDDSL